MHSTTGNFVALDLLNPERNRLSTEIIHLPTSTLSI